MARNRNREFSEGNGLKPMDLGGYAPDAEERLPAWAQRGEKDKLSAWKPPAAETKNDDTPEENAPLPEKAGDQPEAHSPDDAPAEETRPEQKPADEPEPQRKKDGADVGQENKPPEEKRERIVQTRAEKKPENSEPREAHRVESSAFSRRNSGAANSGDKARKTGKKAPGKGKKSKKKKARKDEQQSFLRMMIIILLCGVLFLMAALMVVSNFVKLPILSVPQKIVTGVVSPIQGFFSSVADNVANYLRMLKIRGNIEYEYEELRKTVDELSTEVAMNRELQREVEELRNQLYEQQQPSHQAMNPIMAQVIGKVGNNYFSTLTLDVGSDKGVADYMAVVAGGGLVGVTYNVKPNQCNVRCIIDSDCTVAGLVQSSRDQGSVKGTLGTNGEPMCRMYYLPDNSLPRPNDVVVTSGVGLEFPKGIPIGYIRESTRGMEENKSYVVLEPVVDFQHLEYVTVYRYRPSYAENAQERTSTSQMIRLEPLVTARPVPSFEMEGLSDFMGGTTAVPGATATPAVNVSPSPTPKLTPTPDPHATALPPNLEYVAPNTFGETPSPTPRPTFTPTPTPVPTSDPGAMTVEDDE